MGGAIIAKMGGAVSFLWEVCSKNHWSSRMDSWMDEWVNGRIDGWMDGWIDGWMDGWMIGRIERMDG